MMTDDELIERAITEASAEHRSVAEVTLLRAIALTREEARRHELERQARARLQHAGDVALQVLAFVFRAAVT